MAQIVGCLMTSHVPAIGGAIARDAQREPYWEPFFQGYNAVHAWLAVHVRTRWSCSITTTA